MNYFAIYGFFHKFLHIFYTIIKFFYLLVEAAREYLVNFCHELKQPNDNSGDDIKRVPRHLTVLLGKEEPSFTDLPNIVHWCLSYGIGYLSFYDWKGTLKKNEDKLIKEVEHLKLPNDHIIWHTNPNCSYQNGYTGRKIHIKVLTEDDGRLGLVNLTKQLASKSKNFDVSVDSLDRIIQRQVGFPDPDMGIYCGTSLNLFNYPPWQIRLTEFFCVKSHHRLSYRTFHRLLCLFSKCEQRLGK